MIRRSASTTARPPGVTGNVRGRQAFLSEVARRNLNCPIDAPSSGGRDRRRNASLSTPCAGRAVGLPSPVMSMRRDLPFDLRKDSAPSKGSDTAPLPRRVANDGRHEDDALFHLIEVGVQTLPSNITREVSQDSTRETPVHNKEFVRMKANLSPSLRTTFAPNRWLSDASISFAYARLTEDNESSGAGKLPEELLLLDPATAFWLTVQREMKYVHEAVNALKLQERELVLCPISDARDGRRVDGGSHWGLLVWDRKNVYDNPGSCDAPSGAKDSGSRRPWGPFYNKENMRGGQEEAAGCGIGSFIYYDSLGYHTGVNLQQAKKLAERLAGRNTKVSLANCPRQTNFCDCGMYVVVNSELIAETFLEGLAARAQENCIGYGNSVNDCKRTSAPPWAHLIARVTPVDVVNRRAFYYNLGRPQSK